MRVVLFLLVFFCALFIFGTSGVADQTPPKPNIVVIVIDDIGWSDLSCYGNQAVETPHIDRLAKEGIAFTQFYVASPICSPTRCAILTGQYPYRWRITSYLYNKSMNEERGMAHWLDLSAPSIARFFQQAGYATGHFGKWHLGGGLHDVDDAPLITEYGFDVSLTNFCGLGPRVLPLLNVFDGSEPRKYTHGSDGIGCNEIAWVDRNKVTEFYVNKTLEFIEKAEKEGKPFFVNLWTDDVHSPFFPSKELRGDGSKRALYHGVLAEMDSQLAPLFDYVRNSATLQNNTLILFLSDNGPEGGAGSSAPLRGSKGMLFEGGVRSPLIVWGNGLLDESKRGFRNETAVLWVLDFMPSLLKIAGIEVTPEIKFDGEDFSDVLLGRKVEQSRQTPLLWRRPPDRPGPENNPWADLAVREDHWKFLMQYDGSLPRLYDLSRDVSESNNLSGQYPEMVARYRKILLDWNETLPKDAGELR